SERSRRSITPHCFTLCLEQQPRRPARPRSTSGGNASSTRWCVERERAPFRLVACDLPKLLLLASFFRFLALVISRLAATRSAPRSPRLRYSFTSLATRH